MSMFELVFELEVAILTFSNDDRIVPLSGCVLFFRFMDDITPNMTRSDHKHTKHFLWRPSDICDMNTDWLTLSDLPSVHRS